MLESNTITPLQVSKWIKIPFLIDSEEMEHLLLTHMPPFQLYDVQKLTPKGEGIYGPQIFLNHYEQYISYLKRGSIPPQEMFRSFFSMAWSVTEEAFYSIPSGEKRLIRASEPIIQSQMNQIHYAPEEKEFRTQLYGADGMSWGIQLGFPYLFLDPKTSEISNTKAFPNMPLFSSLQKWIRTYTLPTPFIVDSKRINSPIRLGKKCFPWIASHPQLKIWGIRIDRT